VKDERGYRFLSSTFLHLGKLCTMTLTSEVKKKELGDTPNFLRSLQTRSIAWDPRPDLFRASRRLARRAESGTRAGSKSGMRAEPESGEGPDSGRREVPESLFSGDPPFKKPWYNSRLRWPTSRERSWSLFLPR
jgi:hypothetical protein